MNPMYLKMHIIGTLGDITVVHPEPPITVCLASHTTTHSIANSGPSHC